MWQWNVSVRQTSPLLAAGHRLVLGYSEQRSGEANASEKQQTDHVAMSTKTPVKNCDGDKESSAQITRNSKEAENKREQSSSYPWDVSRIYPFVIPPFIGWSSAELPL